MSDVNGQKNGNKKFIVNGQDVIVFGGEALDIMHMEASMKESDGTLQANEMKIFEVYDWLLGFENKAVVKALMTKLYSKAAGKAKLEAIDTADGIKQAETWNADMALSLSSLKARKLHA